MAEPLRAGRRGRIAAQVTAALLALAGAAQAVAATRTVTIEGMKFAPSSLTVRRGDTVVWVNHDLVPHTATAAGTFDSQPIAPNKSWTYVASKAGRHDYVCTLHPTMKATLVVE